MGFIKHGDGKIVTVLDEEDLTEEQKKAIKESRQMVKQSDQGTDTSDSKKSGR